MRRRASPIAALLFFSGMCALIYQVAWLRELRLVFGASTPASAAVLAVFMGGLGAGSLLLGKRAERTDKPLALYAHLELGIAATAAITPGLLMLARAGYFAAGGSTTLGPVLGTVVRLLLSAIVLGPPTVMMGGTLPAAARAATSEGDVGRRTVALLYGLNTLGAVTGAVLSTFLMLEIFGTRATLWIGCLLNALVGMSARALSRSLDAPSANADPDAVADANPDAVADAAPARFVLAASAAAGFVFLLMELVWYRMLAPLLGGSSYTFGLILAVALFGIGAGGLAYTLRRNERPATLSAFALTCALEAAFMSVPFAAGDRIAWLALFLRPLGSIGLSGHVIAWTVITSTLVLPAAIVAGYQFPLLIALLGRAERGIGRHVGLAYACNTLGAIAGSLAGGFALMPLLGAPGAWKLTVWVLVAMALAALVLQLRAGQERGRAVAPLALSIAALAFIHGSLGPTSFWRHSPIGAGRADDYVQSATRNRMKEQRRRANASVSWDADGRESTVALNTYDDTAFYVNGKSDGAAISDAGTQVMSGLLGALLHEGPIKRVLIVGLGTGSTAGWLGKIPEVDRVDVVELEPAIVDVARACAAVNEDVLDNPKVHIVIGDAREVLLTGRSKYDLIFSEPSNPYRAGIASLFTKEFYQAARARLEPGGVFVQWVQTYEIDAISVRTVYTTLSSTFPSVESWRTKYADVVLLSREADRPLDTGELRQRMASSPYREALLGVWRARTVEDVLAHFLARPSFAAAVARAEGEAFVNTDDVNLFEFSVARAIGRPQDFSADRLLTAAHERGEARPAFSGDGAATIAWPAVYDGMLVMRLVAEGPPIPPPILDLPDDMGHRLRAEGAWYADRPAAAIREWELQDKPPTNAIELLMMADVYAETGQAAKAEPLIVRLHEVSAIEADVARAKLSFARGDFAGAWDALERALVAYRKDPWANPMLMRRALMFVLEIADASRGLYPRIEPVLREDFVERSLRQTRLDVYASLTLRYGGDECVGAIAAYGRWFPWREQPLRQRVDCFAKSRRPELAGARAELDDFLADASVDFARHIRPEKPLAKVKAAPAASR